MRMKWLLASLYALLAFAPRARANVDHCPAEYSTEQCQQAEGDDGTGGNPGDPGGGGSSPSCRYYLCTNSEPSILPYWDWCTSKGTFTDCPTTACYYRPCLGSSCSVVTEGVSCMTCPERQGSNVRISGCPRT